MLAAVREAMKYATLENAEFGAIWRESPEGQFAPILNRAGEHVTEANVTEFIRERVRAHHSFWIIGTLESVQQQLVRETAHTFRADKGLGFTCVHCGASESHRSHQK